LAYAKSIIKNEYDSRDTTLKTKYLDLKNCHALLPDFPRIPFLKHLEGYLTQINETELPSKSTIDLLIRQNRNTLGAIHGSRRLCRSQIEVAQSATLAAEDIETQAKLRSPIAPAYLHRIVEYPDGIRWKTMIPLQFLLKGWGDVTLGHQGYIHSISRNMDGPMVGESIKTRPDTNGDDYYYVGITGRNWLLRLREHIGEMQRGSRKKFHEMWRDSMGLDNVLFLSVLREVNLSFDEAMNWEEENVKKVAYGPCGLNMIEGGFAGIRELHRLRLIDRTNISLDEREIAINQFIQKYPRKGIPNPFISALWQDDDFYAKIMGARAMTLSLEQVKKIRALSQTGLSLKQITREVSALNELQVKNVISGKTYTRYK